MPSCIFRFILVECRGRGQASRGLTEGRYELLVSAQQRRAFVSAGIDIQSGKIGCRGQFVKANDTRFGRVNARGVTESYSLAIPVPLLFFVFQIGRVANRDS